MSFRFKTMCGVAAIEAVLLCLLIVGNLGFLRESNTDQLTNRARTMASLLAAVVQTDVLAMDLASLESRVQTLGREQSMVFVRVVSTNRGVLASYQAAPRAAADVVRARADIAEAGIVYGWVEVGLSDTAIGEVLGLAKRQALVTAGLGMALSALFSLGLGYYLTRQLDSLTEASEAIAAGRFDHHVPVSGRDELAQTARAFNRMAEELRRGYGELAEKAENFTAFYNTVDAYLMVLDATGRVMNANEALRTRLGYLDLSPAGRDVLTLFDPLGRETVRRAMAGLTDGRVASLDVPMQDRNGLSVQVETRMVRGKWNGRPAFFAIGKDVSDQRRSEGRFRSIADFTYDWEYWLSPDGCFEWVSPACQRITGYAPQAFLDDPGLLARITQPEDRHIVDSHMVQARYRGLGPCAEQFRIRRSDGSLVWIEHCCRAIFDPSGVFLGRRGCNRDITESRRVRDELFAAKGAAEAASRAKTQFLATMSHEVRTPLNGIMGMLQMLEGGILSREQAELVGIALESSRKLLTILSDILDIARIESGKVMLCHDTVDPRRLVASVVGIFHPDVAARGMSLELAVDPAMPAAVVTDEGRLRQILFNLVGNAVKFTGEGCLRVWVGPLPVASPTGETRLLFVVSDSGPGISDEKIAYVFNQFCQLDDTMARRHGGLGLGLAIVRRFVELLGGCVCVDSELGSGSTFYATVAVRVTDEPVVRPAVPPAAGASAGRTGLTILVVEDERINQLTIGKLLGRLGHRSVVAGNGAEALERLGREHFDLVLMDIQMPVMDGEETVRRLRASGLDQAAIPVVALTAHAMKGDRERFLDCGMNGYLAKPVDLAALDQVIAEVRSRRPAGAAGEERVGPDP